MRHQAPTHRIIQGVLHLLILIQLLRASQHSIERFFLSHPAMTGAQSIDQMSRPPFDRIHDFTRRVNFASPFVNQRSEDQMNMIGHDHHRVNIHFSSMIMQTTS